jgi:hypothetical protein
MPHRRRVQKGSFSGHFDELVVNHFAQARKATQLKPKEAAKPKRKRKMCIHQALFESAH